MFKSGIRHFGLGVLLMYLCICTSFSCKKKDDSQIIPPVDTTGTPGTLKTDVVFWLTNADQSVKLKKQNVSLLFGTTANQFPSIHVDSTQSFQTMDGFGFCMTGGSAYLINHLPATDRDALIRELFGNDSTSIGISYLRISIGSSDLNSSVFSYDDMSGGQTDAGLVNFSLAPDQADLIPVLRQALVQNPNLKILGSPWSAPAWMKTNNSTIGGSLKAEYYDAYARYLVKYIIGMQAEGIHIDAITPQNEPLNPGNNPSVNCMPLTAKWLNPVILYRVASVNGYKGAWI